MDDSILEFITEYSDDVFIEYIDPIDNTFTDFQDEELLLDDDSVVIYDDDAVSDPEDVAPENIVNTVNDIISSSDVQSALSSETGSLKGGTYNIYNITLSQQENISEVPEEEIQEEQVQEAITETQYNLDDIYSKLDGLSSDVSVLKSNNYNHSQNMEKIGLTVVGLCVALLGGLVAYSVFNHIRP